MRQEDWESSPGYNERPYLNKLKTEPAEESGELKPKDSGKQPGGFLEAKVNSTKAFLDPQGKLGAPSRESCARRVGTGRFVHSREYHIA